MDVCLNNIHHILYLFSFENMKQNMNLPGDPGGPSTDKVVTDDISSITLRTIHLYSPESSNVTL